ncbi:MAG: NAD(P)H-hydrate epimerase [Phycisphaerales bacterium]|nr:NAD(P)H-hydrate epimerase [Phycisphaerales bacterium]
MTRALSSQEAANYDRACARVLGIPGIVLMTHAAVECAAFIRAHCGQATNFVAVCGSGNNGGDGYAIVRTLASHGLAASALEVAAPRASSDAALMHQWATAMGLVARFDALAASLVDPEHTLIIDAVFGIGLTRPPQGAALEAISWINAQRARGARVVAIDLPSGIDGDLGVALGGANSAVRADQTLTMVAPKLGFSAADASEYTGEVTIIPIGGPADPRKLPIME